MASLTWSRSLSTLLGSELNENSSEAVRRLVTDQIAERTELDFKREIYGAKKDDPRELAADIAAMANAVGGVILLGVDEQESVASALVPIDAEKRDTEPRRIHEIVAQRVAPVPVIHTEWIEIESGGVIAIVVPPSRGAPHAVGRDGSPTNPYLCWPRRDGTRKRYLSEFEISDAYSARARMARGDRERLDQIWSDLVSLLDQDQDLVWLSAALVPSLPGSFRLAEWDEGRIGGEILQPWLDLPLEQRPRGGLPLRRTPRLQRLRFHHEPQFPTTQPVTEVFVDGAVTAASTVGAAVDNGGVLPPHLDGRANVADRELFLELCALLGGVLFLSSATGAGGAEASLRISLEGKNGTFGTREAFSRFRPWDDGLTGEDFEFDRTIDLNATTTSDGYLRLLGLVAADIWNGLGARTCPYITLDGRMTGQGHSVMARGDHRWRLPS